MNAANELTFDKEITDDDVDETSKSCWLDVVGLGFGQCVGSLFQS